MLTELAAMPRRKEELVAAVWGLSRYAPDRHDAVLQQVVAGSGLPWVNAISS